MRTGHHSWRSFTVILTLLLTVALLSACSISIGSVTTQTPAPSASRTAGATPGSQGCVPQTKHDDGASDSQVTYLSPKQFWAIYGIEPLLKQCYTGKGQTVVVIDSFGSPTLQTDIDQFSDYYGLPRVKLQIVAPIGTKPFNPNDREMSGWAGETTIDVQIIHAVAPDANIVVLTSPVDETEGVQGLPEFLQLEQYAAQHYPGAIVSQSWAASEVSLADSAGQAEISQFDAFYHTATTTQGMTFFASSGDEGATDCVSLNSSGDCVPSTTASTGFPNSNPWVTAVGGTTIQENGSQFSEVGWDGSGGGFSRFYPIPSYQQGLPASAQQQLNHRRGVPDVAASADPTIGLGCISSSSGLFAAGGTSAGSPLWAGLAAIANQMAGHPLGFLNPVLYKIAAGPNYARDFHDVTNGNNSYDQNGVSVPGYDAVPGWDPITGLGTPNAQYLLPDLIAAVGAGGS
ncbi:MAG TPA: S53 family peptidase [Ktedonobacterales bacterium]|nr:S53 family peptidase [Ktedonobacterales bacterium]